MRRVEREPGAAVLEHDARLARHDPRAPLVVDALDQRHAVPRGVGRDAGDRVAAFDPGGRGTRRGAIHRDAPSAVPEVGRVEETPERHGDTLRIGEPAVTVAEGELRGLDREVDVVGRLGRAGPDVDALEDPQHRQRDQPLAGRRDRGRDAPAIRHRRRLGPARPVAGEIGRAERASDRLARVPDLGRQLPFVEGAPALAGEPLERARQAGLGERPPRRGRRALLEVGRAERREGGLVRPEQVGRARRDARLARRHGDAVGGVPDRGLEEIAPRDRRAEALLAEAVGRPEAVGRAGHGERGQRPAGRDRREPVTAVQLRSGARRGRARGLEGGEARGPRVPAQPEAVAAEPRHVRVHDGQRRADGHRGVDRGAAAEEHLEAGDGGERMGGGDDPAAPEGGRPAGLRHRTGWRPRPSGAPRCRTP